jgi:hypothetical protein
MVCQSKVTRPLLLKLSEAFPFTPSRSCSPLLVGKAFEELKESIREESECNRLVVQRARARLR